MDINLMPLLMTHTVETVKQLPDWAISAIAILALVSGVVGGRSQVAAQLIHHVMAIVALLAGNMTRSSPSGTNNSSSNEEATEMDSCPQSAQPYARQSSESSRISQSSTISQSQANSSALSAVPEQAVSSQTLPQSGPLSRVSIESVRFS